MMNSTVAATNSACMTSSDPNSNFVSHLRPEISNVTVGEFYHPSKTKTPLFHFSFSHQQEMKTIHESCQKIFTAIGNRDTKALSELVKDPKANFDQTAVVYFVVQQFVLKGSFTIRPLSAAALIGSEEMVRALVSTASPDNLTSYLKNFHPYYKNCHAIILQHIENSTDLAAANNAGIQLNHTIVDLSFQIGNSSNNPLAATVARNTYNNLYPLALERMTEINNIFISVSARRQELIATCIRIAPLVSIIEEYAPLV